MAILNKIYDKIYRQCTCHSQSSKVFKVSGPFVEPPCIFLCMQNINYAEISA